MRVRSAGRARKLCFCCQLLGTACWIFGQGQVTQCFCVALLLMSSTFMMAEPNPVDTVFTWVWMTPPILTTVGDWKFILEIETWKILKGATTTFVAFQSQLPIAFPEQPFHPRLWRRACRLGVEMSCCSCPAASSKRPFSCTNHCGYCRWACNPSVKYKYKCACFVLGKKVFIKKTSVLVTGVTSPIMQQPPPHVRVEWRENPLRPAKMIDEDLLTAANSGY